MILVVRLGKSYLQKALDRSKLTFTPTVAKTKFGLLKPAHRWKNLQKETKTPHLAPNGKPSNLNPAQWKMVRTPEFKAQFGDWELFALNNSLRHVRGSDQILAIKSELIGKPFRNIESGIVATISGESLRKMMSSAARLGSVSPQAHYQALGNIEKLFSLATLRETRAGKKEGDNDVLSAIHHFEVPMPFMDDVLRIKMMVKEFQEKEYGSRLYLINAVEIETPASLHGEASTEEHSSHRPAGVTDKLARMVESVKGKNVLKDLDENGEPRADYVETFAINNPKTTKSLTWSGYRLQGRTRIHGMDISIENKKGSVRRGTDKDGHAWRTKMHFAYGYIRGTVGKDKDHLDCYIGPNPESTKVFVIHQNDPVTGKYDEDKVMLGFGDATEAKRAYLKQYDRPGFLGSMDETDIDSFKKKAFAKANKGKKLVLKAFVIPSELSMGIKVEMEHTDDPEVAKKIAKEHLARLTRMPTRDNTGRATYSDERRPLPPSLLMDAAQDTLHVGLPRRRFIKIAKKYYSKLKAAGLAEALEE